MAFLNQSFKNKTGDTLNALISDTDQKITALVARRTELLGWVTTLNNDSTFLAADKTEYNAELTRLNNRITNEL